MTQMESYIPDWLIKRSFGFKTSVLIIGAVLLLASTILRPEYPLLWIPIFLLGALIEWLIVATVYIEINQIERAITDAKEDIDRVLEEIKNIERDVESTQVEIEETKEDIFSSFSQSQGGFDSIENRIEDIENEVRIGNIGAVGQNLQSKVSELNERVDRLERESDRGRF